MNTSDPPPFHLDKHDDPTSKRPSKRPSKPLRSNSERPALISTKKLGIVTPPQNFAIVEPGLYRAALPSADNFSYIRSLTLKRVIILSAERPEKAVSKFFEAHNIQVSHTGLHAWTSNADWKPIGEEVVKESLEIILRRDSYPLLVCDVGGIHMVGMVIGCLRRLQNWNLNSVVSEYRSFSGPKTRYFNEQFIELFDIDLVTLPDDPPAWFAEQMEMDLKDKEAFNKLVDTEKVDESGSRVDSDNSPKYLCYYFSSSSPLNSEIGGMTPRIQTL